MEKDFYIGRLRDLHGLEVILPDAAARDDVHRIIYEELCHGRVLDSSRRRYEEIIAMLCAQGAQGIIFGCTEITMLVSEASAPAPVFDTTLIHAEAAVEYALGSV
jgi:aspartate racemase